MTSSSVDALDVVEDGHDPGRPVGGEGVDVEVGPAEAIGHRARAAPLGRSGQIGKKTAHHCSGARATCCSNAARLGLELRGDPLAARALGRDRHRVEPPV